MGVIKPWRFETMTLSEALKILRDGSTASAKDHDDAVEFAIAVLAALAGEENGEPV